MSRHAICRLLMVMVMVMVGVMVIVGVMVGGSLAWGEEFVLHSFRRQQLTDTYYSEGATAGDIDGDGHIDVIHGPYWFAGPSFRVKREIYAAKPQPNHGYADSFFQWVCDVDTDGHNDVVAVGFPGTSAYVYQNPGKDGYLSPWQKHEVIDGIGNEAPQFVDIDGDDRPELVAVRNGRFGYAVQNREQPFGKWKFIAISDDLGAGKFTHGLGVGDVNGDQRLDVLSKDGWFEQPIQCDESTPWKFHPVAFSGPGGADMFAYDVDGDGDNDVITSLEAHAFGLAWYEQLERKKNGPIQFEKHVIMGYRRAENPYGVLFTELHAVNLVDMDADGLKDIVTGKTYWSHHTQSPLWDDGAVVYWFRLVRKNNRVDWVPYQVDGDVGIGRQLTIADLNDDSLPDIVVGGMKGAHLLFCERQSVDRATWEKAQPALYRGPLPVTAKDADRLRGEPAQIDKRSGHVTDGIEGESLKVSVTAGTAQVQDMRPFAKDRWSGSKHLWWTGAHPGAALSFDLSVEEGGAHDLEIVLTCARDYAIVRLLIDDEPLADPIDLYDPDVIATGVLTFRTQSLKPGKHRLTIEIVGANERAAKAFMVGVDYLRLRPAQGKPRSNAKAPALSTSVLRKDDYPHAGLSPQRAAAEMNLPAGFHVEVFAGEPDVKQPIAMALDDRGRIWIAEAYEYPIRAKQGAGRDRILVFEDTDGDHHFDKRTVFAEGLNLVSGLEVGFGGVWVGAAPNLLFIPDEDHDDVPDSEPQVLLDGWGYEDTHETLNSFIWGPDGWLYGCHGVFTHSRVGKPGTPDAQRTPLNAAIWRYHPTRHQFEVFAHGTSNPWGVDFNDHGQAICTACVIPHLFHIIQGGRYHRQAGSHFNTHTYDDIKTIADHLHYLGTDQWESAGKSDQAGGGHAHCGAMIYQGGEWPDAYRNQIFMNNIHGQRVNMDRLSPRGSGYVGTHGPDFIRTGDVASQILNLRYGPDGNAFMIDWYDMQACHIAEADRHDRSNGRIYKVIYGEPQSVTVDLAKLTDRELAELVLHENDWYVRHARRILQERATKRRVDAAAVDRLIEIATQHEDATRRLRAAWSLHVIGRLSDRETLELLADPNEFVRAWSIQLALDGHHPSQALLTQFATLAETDPSPVVRLYLAAACQRLPLGDRWNILRNLVRHDEDAVDQNLPLMVWYAAEPLAEHDPTQAMILGLSASGTIPVFRDYMLRRIGSLDSHSALGMLVDGLGQIDAGIPDEAELQLAFLREIRKALQGQRHVVPPSAWKQVYANTIRSENADVRAEAMALGVTFGDESARASLRQLLQSQAADPTHRRLALRALVAAKAPGLAATLCDLLSDSDLRAPALVGLAQTNTPETPNRVLSAYSEFSVSEKQLALAALCSRKSYADALLTAIEEKRIPNTDLSADLVRQLQMLDDPEVSKQLNRVWGTVRHSAAEKLALVEEYKQIFAHPIDDGVDLSLGRAIFSRTCQRCHKLYGVGDDVGPDLTGSNRANLDYLLTNIVDPSAVMAKEYQPTVVFTEDGGVITGLVRSENEKALTIQTGDSLVVIPQNEIEERHLGQMSMMPEDQLKQFSQHEVRALLGYLSASGQVPMLADPDNAKTLFNGKDLSGWTGDKSLWRVDHGEIVGKSPGIQKNAFLISDLTAADFRMALEVKLVRDIGNSGIQFRSTALPRHAVKGYQADIGPGWWGKLYEEHGRELLWERTGAEYVKKGEWNKYEIQAEGSRVRTWINGNLCVDMQDAEGARRGVFALQLHSGGPMEVRFRRLKLEVIEPPSESEKENQTATDASAAGVGN